MDEFRDLFYIVMEQIDMYLPKKKLYNQKTAYLWCYAPGIDLDLEEKSASCAEVPPEVIASVPDHEKFLQAILSTFPQLISDKQPTMSFKSQ